MANDYYNGWYKVVSSDVDYEYLARRLFELSEERNSKFTLAKVSIDKKESSRIYTVKLYFCMTLDEYYDVICEINSDGLSDVSINMIVGNGKAIKIGTGLTPLSDLEGFLLEAKDLIYEFFRRICSKPL